MFSSLSPAQSNRLEGVEVCSVRTPAWAESRTTPQYCTVVWHTNHAIGILNVAFTCFNFQEQKKHESAYNTYTFAMV
jgi:hypothetical protein